LINQSVICLISLVVYTAFVAMSADAVPPGNDWQPLYANACKEFEVGHNDQAEALFEKALAAAQAFGKTDTRYLRTANYLADVAFINSKLDEAGQLYTMVLDNTHDPVLIKHSANSLRDVANAMSTFDTKKSAKVWERIFQVPPDAIEPDQWVDSLWRVVKLPFSKDQLNAHIDKVLTAIKPGINDRFAARKMCMIAEFLEQKSDACREAMRCAASVLESPFRRANPDDTLICESLNLATRCYLKEQKLKEAEHAIDQSMAILERQKEHYRAKLTTLQLQTQVYGAAGACAKQEAALLALAQTALLAHTPHIESNAWTLLAALYGYRGETKKSQDCKKRAAEALKHPARPLTDTSQSKTSDFDAF
jgi:tetratricopeptide (TPR) repeat protein